MLRRLLVVFTLAISPLLSFAIDQSSGGVELRVLMPGGATCRPGTEVLLLNNGGMRMADVFTNGQCTVQVNNLPAGTYRAVVSAPGFESTNVDGITVDSTGAHGVDVMMRAANDHQQVSGSAPISAAELKVPDGARKEFEKATELMTNEKWDKAVQKLNAALTIYPQYPDAYNNLGVVYSRLNQRAQEKDALLKAISIDDHFAPALVNLGRMAIVDHDFPAAEGFLDRAVSADPVNSMALVLLANVQLMTQHYTEALTNCRKAHALSQPNHSLAHFVAARILEHNNQPPEAVAELRTFLSEENAGPRADAARKELASLTSNLTAGH
jgi:Tfp pilus assembly protein PilF